MKKVQVYLDGSFLTLVPEGTDIENPEFRREMFRRFYDALGEQDESIFTMHSELR